MSSITVGEILSIIKASKLKSSDKIRFHLSDRSEEIDGTVYETELNSVETISFDGCDHKCFDLILDLYPAGLE